MSLKEYEEEIWRNLGKWTCVLAWKRRFCYNCHIFDILIMFYNDDHDYDDSIY